MVEGVADSLLVALRVWLRVWLRFWLRVLLRLWLRVWSMMRVKGGMGEAADEGLDNGHAE